MKIQTDNIDSMEQITISGERQEKENKFVYFEQKFKVPENSDIQKATGKIEDGILTVTVPKRMVAVKEDVKILDHEKELKKEIQEPREKKHKDESKEEKSQREYCMESKEILEKWENEGSLFKSALKLLQRNKGIVLTAVLAFSLGVFVSRKFDSSSSGKLL